MEVFSSDEIKMVITLTAYICVVVILWYLCRIYQPAKGQNISIEGTNIQGRVMSKRQEKRW